MPLIFSRNIILTYRSRSVSEIDELYERNIPAWRWSKTVTAAEEQMRLVVQLKGVRTMEGEA